ncbi:MAG TPA: hypothetical protein VGE55_06580 [Limnobacter sp.]|uniref:hypothetical protein n=1 Tax=Limnobacter sp. TaxID=2003368 RepID=UPI002EDA077B
MTHRPNLARILALFALPLLSSCLGNTDSGSSANGNRLVEGQGANVGKTRYQFNNQCLAIQAADTGQYLTRDGDSWANNTADLDQAAGIYFKPAALGEYLLYTESGELLTSAGTGNLLTVSPLSQANPLAVWTLRIKGDTTVYPTAPDPAKEADPVLLAAYRGFIDPDIRGDQFELVSAQGQALPQAYRLRELPAARCAEFPEAQSNVDGDTFKGPELLGYADTHLHATSTTFLGGAKPGGPFHKFGVTHALASCAAEHGPTGHGDVVGSLFTGDVDGHNTAGWPTFPDWPSRTATTHEATYWKWMERAWKAGLRLIVNFAVDNQTLCEVQRNAAGKPTQNCNEMLSAKRQLNTAWALQDYIDAQYGGRGAGWWRIVTTPAQARDVIAQGKAAVLLGVEVSNLLDCSVTFNPLNQQEGFEETSEPRTGQLYGCTMTETGAPHEILTQLKELKAIGVSNLFTVHEFDNAFGGSDIFEGLVLNLGNRENSGGLNNVQKSLALQTGAPNQLAALQQFEPIGLATGEFWTTHTCPSLTDVAVGGSIFPALGATMTNLGPPPPACAFTGRGGRPGGKTACYPSEPQCNARTLTPIGLYTFGKVMELGFNFEIDHLGYELKNQLLDLTLAQQPHYPTISGHGFSGLSVVQAKRIFQGGGLVYPTYNDTPDFISLWQKIRSAWKASGSNIPFAMGFGSDTNGLSPQAAPRKTIQQGHEVRYPFELFKGKGFDALKEFNQREALRFDQPAAKAPDGTGRTWNEDTDGNAHYGMAADSIEELRQDAPPALLQDLYGSALAYVAFWERTQAASQAVRNNGLKMPAQLLRPAPK